MLNPKNIFFTLLLLLISLNSFGKSYIRETSCTGMERSGDLITVVFHLPIEFFCSQSQENLEGLIVITSPLSGQNALSGIIQTTTTQGQTTANLSISHTEDHQLEGTFTIGASYTTDHLTGAGSGKYSQKFTAADGTIIEEESVTLTCLTNLYNIDCSNQETPEAI